MRAEVIEMKTTTFGTLVFISLISLSLTFCANPVGSSAGPGAAAGNQPDETGPVAPVAPVADADDGSLFDTDATDLEADEPVALDDYGFQSSEGVDEFGDVSVSSAFVLVNDGEQNIIRLTPTADANSYTLLSPVFARTYHRSNQVAVEYKVRFTGDRYPISSGDQYRAVFVLYNESVPAYRVSIVSATSGRDGARNAADSNATIRLEVMDGDTGIWARPEGFSADRDLGWINPLGATEADWISVTANFTANRIAIVASLPGEQDFTAEFDDTRWDRFDQWGFVVQSHRGEQFSAGGGVDLGAVRVSTGR
jgi:hypothetical protein